MGSLLKEESVTLWSEFTRQVGIHPNKTAIIDGAQSRSYAELQETAIFQGKQLRQRYFHIKITNSQFVAILLPPGLDYVTTMLSLFASSRTTAPLSVDYPVKKLEFMLEDLGHPLLITKSSILAAIGLSYSNAILIDTIDWEEREDRIQANSELKTNGILPHNSEEQRPYASAYYTSGSTGIPKAVLMDHSSLLHFFLGSVKRFNITSNDSTTCMLNPAFIFSGYEIWTSLLAGATINVVPTNLRYDIPNLRQWIKEKCITIVCMVSSSAETFIKVGLEEFSSTHRLLLCGGEKLQARPPGGAPFTVYSMYGSTEAKTATGTRVDPIAPSYYPSSHTLAGKGFPGVEVFVLDEETLTPVAAGETGEIVIGGPVISQGYFNRPEESAQKFFKLNGKHVCRTGDLGYFLPTGDLIVLNRRDNQIKVSGYRFDLADLESALVQHTSVDKAVAVVEKGNDLRIHLFYKLNCAGVSMYDLGEFLQNNLPHYAFPHSLIQVDDFPLTANGKLDKNALLMKVSQQERVIQPAITETEILIAETWAGVLGITRSEISRNDNFFAIGGSSMLALQFIAQLQLRNPEFKVEPFNVFKAPILKNFAEVLDSKSLSAQDGVMDLEAEVARFEIDQGKLRDIPTFDPNQKPKAILVTGATGYLGAGLVVELLEQTEADIYCLVRTRGSDSTDGRDRLFECMRGFNMAVQTNDLHRLHIVSGDLSLPFFGLNEAEFGVLAEEIDQVFHCAAEVHWLKRYQELRAPNVEGTMEIIKFVSTRRLKFLHHISTIGVIGICSDSNIQQLESKEMAATVDTEMGYTQSKWVAEKLVWKAIEAGIPAIIYRPGIIGSHSKNGIGTVNPHDFITLLFKACKDVGAYPVLPWQFPYGSLDFTSKCIVSISTNLKNNQLKVFHTFQQILSFDDFFGELASRSLEKMSVSEWKSELLQASARDPASVVLGMIKLFLYIPYYQGMTFFELPFSKLNISNFETMAALSTSEPKSEFVDKIGQIRDFASAVLPL